LPLAIEVNNLGKHYRLGGQDKVYSSLREDLVNAFKKPFQRNQDKGNDDFWALRDVSFNVERGEVLGIIGRNGAGKSTLLKILSRITKPTEGQAILHGRVGSLLEVGTGFHPELTGRENIFLSGSILGMTRIEIKKKFDEIVAFSELERFLDTPVKHYSSGMYVRLAFAVAAHLDPEILLIDEVLAVGDAEFQKKCLGKMGEVTKHGKTVLFVSHNMTSIQRLCNKACLLDKGLLSEFGETQQIISDYYKINNLDDNSSRTVPKGNIRVVKWEVKNAYPDYSCISGNECILSFDIVSKRKVERANFGLTLWTSDGILAWAIRSIDHGKPLVNLIEGKYKIAFQIQSLPLRPGLYDCLISINNIDEGNLDAWYTNPKLHILANNNDQGLPPEWQGLFMAPGNFNMTKC